MVQEMDAWSVYCHIPKRHVPSFMYCTARRKKKKKGKRKAKDTHKTLTKTDKSRGIKQASQLGISDVRWWVSKEPSNCEKEFSSLKQGETLRKVNVCTALAINKN